MIYGAVLALHIVAACVTFAVIAGVGIALLKQMHRFYKPLGLSLALVALVQIASGVMMIVLNPELSVLKVGLHLLVYLGVCVMVEGALYLKARSVAWTS